MCPPSAQSLVTGSQFKMPIEMLSDGEGTKSTVPFVLKHLGYVAVFITLARKSFYQAQLTACISLFQGHATLS